MVWRPERIRTQRTQNKVVIVHHYVCLSVYLGGRMLAVQIPSCSYNLAHFLHGHFPWRCHPSLFLGLVSPLSLNTWRPECIRTQRNQKKFVIVCYCAFVSSSYLGARISAVHSIPLLSPQFLHGHFPWRCHPSLFLGPISPLS